MKKIKRMERWKKWSDISILDKLPNPAAEGYEIKHETKELIFKGRDKQPDIAHLALYFYPNNWAIELKSLKFYFHQFHDKIISYERLINVIYYDLMYVYRPHRLRVEMETNPRGGISSVLVIDSDWKVRGGKEEFGDWKMRRR